MTTTLNARFNGDGTFRTIKISDDIGEKLKVHGANQKANDSYVQKDKNGNAKYPTMAEKKARWNETLDTLVAGDWTTRGDAMSPVERKAWALVEAGLAKKGLKGKALDAEAERMMAIPANLEAMLKRANAAIMAESGLIADLPDFVAEAPKEPSA